MTANVGIVTPLASSAVIALVKIPTNFMRNGGRFDGRPITCSA